MADLSGVAIYVHAPVVLLSKPEQGSDLFVGHGRLFGPHGSCKWYARTYFGQEFGCLRVIRDVVVRCVVDLEAQAFLSQTQRACDSVRVNIHGCLHETILSSNAR